MTRFADKATCAARRWRAALSLLLCAVLALWPLGDALAALTPGTGGRLAAQAEGSGNWEPKPGSTFAVVTDEGRSAVFTVTSEQTVSFGGSTPDVPHTIDWNYSGVITVPGEVEYEGHAFDVTGIADGALAGVFLRYENGTAVYDYSRACAISIPPSVEVIGSRAFYHMEGLKTVEFAEDSTLYSIGNEAFSYTDVSSVEFPASLAALGRSVFAGTSSLRSASFAGTRVTALPQSAFEGTGLQDIDFVPPSVTSLGPRCFANSRLARAVVPASVTDVGESLFAKCASLREASFAEGSTVSEIPAFMFSECTSLREFSVPDRIVLIDDGAFKGSGLRSVEVPAATTYVGMEAFSGCGSLVWAGFAPGSKLMQVEQGTFSDCFQLASVELPATVRTIGKNAFSNCTFLPSFTMPASLRTVGAFAFTGCAMLSRVTFAGDAAHVDCSASAFYDTTSVAEVVYLGKKSTSLLFVSSLPTFYYTVSYYSGKEAARGGDQAGLLGRCVVPARSVPSQVDAGDVLVGSYCERTPAGKAWVCEAGFSQSAPIEDSFYAYAGGSADDLGPGDTFTAETVEEAEVAYTVTKGASGDAPGEVAVGFPGGLDVAIDAATTGSVTLPSLVVGPDSNPYEVTSISPYAFSGCGRFVGVTVPATVASIGAGAFSRCTTLRNVFFESDASLLVDAGMFAGCGQIRRVVFGGKKANVSFGTSDPDVYYTVRYYASEADLKAGRVQAAVLVRERALLGSLAAGDVLSGSVPALGPAFDWAYEPGFSGAKPLSDSTYAYADSGGFQVAVAVKGGNVESAPCWFKAVSFDGDAGRGAVMVGLGKDGVTAVGTAVSGTVVLPASVRDADGNVYSVAGIGDYAFGSEDYVTACSQLASVEMASSVESIGAAAFKNCRKMTSVDIPSSVSQVGEHAFAGCTALKRVAFGAGSGLRSVPDHAFDACTSLESASLPESVERVGDYAFRECGRLARIRIPSSVVSLGAGAYQNCYGAGEIRFLGPAADVSVGASCFDFGWNVSKLNAVVFMGKKSAAAIASVVARDYSTWQGWFDRNYTVYYDVQFYRDEGRFEAGVQMGHVAVPDDVAVSLVDTFTGSSSYEGFVPDLPAGMAWRCEGGFGFDTRTHDSYYAICGRDLSAATVALEGTSFYYSGDYICPSETLTWTDGTVLVNGVDYEPDPTVGLYHDGFANNRRGPTAFLYLRGIGAYAGQAIGTFSISLQVDSSDSFEVSLAEDAYEYDGRAKRPAVQVGATVMGSAYAVEPGVDYTVGYADNVNAGTASVVVQGKGIFGGRYVRTFTIAPADLRDCAVRAPGGWENTAAAGGKPAFTLVDAHGNTLVEGRDYSVTVDRDGAGGTVYLRGEGNYAGLVSRSYGVPGRGGSGGGSGSGSGAGSGHGSGSGSGTGSGAAPGRSNGSGTAAVSARAAAYVPDSGTAGAAPSPGLEAAESQEGGGARSAEFRLFSMADAVDALPEAIDFVQEGAWVPAVLAALAALAFGAARRSRQFTRALGRRGE